jgi:hypothetical protein
VEIPSKDNSLHGRLISTSKTDVEHVSLKVVLFQVADTHTNMFLVNGLLYRCSAALRQSLHSGLHGTTYQQDGGYRGLHHPQVREI